MYEVEWGIQLKVRGERERVREERKRRKKKEKRRSVQICSFTNYHLPFVDYLDNLIRVIYFEMNWSMSNKVVYMCLCMYECILYWCLKGSEIIYKLEQKTSQ